MQQLQQSRAPITLRVGHNRVDVQVCPAPKVIGAKFGGAHENPKLFTEFDAKKKTKCPVFRYRVCSK